MEKQIHTNEIPLHPPLLEAVDKRGCCHSGLGPESSEVAFGLDSRLRGNDQFVGNSQKSTHSLKGHLLVAILLSSFISACPSSCSKPKTVSIPRDESGIWFKGSVDEAFKIAKSIKTPIFLYWGAVWCPPCNEIKQNVFSKPEFKELMQTVVPVYLDGDSKDAQKWGAKLNALGYPTLLMLSPEGTEVLRISEGVDLAEFSEAFKTAFENARPYKELVKLTVQGKASDQDIKAIAVARKDDGPATSYPDDQVLDIYEALIKKIPPHLDAEKARIVGYLINKAISLQNDGNQPELLAKQITRVQKNAPRYLEFILSNPKNVIAARDFVLYSAPEALDWTVADNNALKRSLKRKWIQAANVIAQSKQLGLSDRLWALEPKIALQMGKRKKAPPKLWAEVHQAVKFTNQNAKTPFERKAVVSVAAYLLQQIKDFDGARKLLKNELKSTNTPWYYQASLARLEEKAGNLQAALKWSKKASMSAKGSATKIQWAANDVLLILKIHKNLSEQIKPTLSAFFSLLTKDSNGFVGRNEKYAEKVAKALKEAVSTPEAKKWFEKERSKCRSLSKAPKSTCEAYFEGILGPNASGR